MIKSFTEALNKSMDFKILKFLLHKFKDYTHLKLFRNFLQKVCLGAFNYAYAEYLTEKIKDIHAKI